MVHIIEQTDQEKYKMYMKCEKSDLVKMLITCNNYLNDIAKTCIVPRFILSDCTRCSGTGKHPGYVDGKYNCPECKGIGKLKYKAN